VAWLLDVVPPDYRLHGVLQRHPIALATLARRHLAACVEGARQGYRTARSELGDALPVSGVDAVLAAYRSEGHRLVTAACAADLVERALRGKEFTPQRHEAPGPPRQQGQRERQGQQAQPEQQARPEQQAQSEQQERQERPERPEQPTRGKQKARQPTPVKQQSVKQQQPVKQQQKQATAAAVPAKQRRKQAVS
jgi:outer membrane biosynthesis protein TonB